MTKQSNAHEDNAAVLCQSFAFFFHTFYFFFKHFTYCFTKNYLIRRNKKVLIFNSFPDRFFFFFF